MHGNFDIVPPVLHLTKYRPNHAPDGAVRLQDHEHTMDSSPPTIVMLATAVVRQAGTVRTEGGRKDKEPHGRKHTESVLRPVGPEDCTALCGTLQRKVTATATRG